MLFDARCRLGGDGVHHAVGDLQADARERLVVEEIEEAMELFARLRGEHPMLRDGRADRDLRVLLPLEQGLDRPKEILNVSLTRAVRLLDGGEIPRDIVT